VGGGGGGGGGFEFRRKMQSLQRNDGEGKRWVPPRHDVRSSICSRKQPLGCHVRLLRSKNSLQGARTVVRACIAHGCTHAQAHTHVLTYAHRHGTHRHRRTHVRMHARQTCSRTHRPTHTCSRTHTGTANTGPHRRTHARPHARTYLRTEYTIICFISQVFFFGTEPTQVCPSLSLSPPLLLFRSLSLSRFVALPFLRKHLSAETQN
jgi:hypothetical protein